MTDDERVLYNGCNQPRKQMLRILALSDTITTCDCCGRQNLKKTVILTESDSRFPGNDEVKAYGTGCAQTALQNAKTPGYRQWVSNAVIQKAARAASFVQRGYVERLESQDGGMEWAAKNNLFVGK